MRGYARAFCGGGAHAWSRRLRGAGAEDGGEGGIRTLDALTGITVFETARFSRSRTSPRVCLHEVAGFPQGREEQLDTDLSLKQRSAGALVTRRFSHPI